MLHTSYCWFLLFFFSTEYDWMNIYNVYTLSMKLDLLVDLSLHLRVFGEASCQTKVLSCPQGCECFGMIQGLNPHRALLGKRNRRDTIHLDAGRP
jgi:hypothetical protein